MRAHHNMHSARMEATRARARLAGLGATALLTLLALGAGANGCAPKNDAANGDACAQATHRLAACGVALPLASPTDGACAGVRRLAAECVNAHADGCDELATLFSRIDACVADLEADAGDPLPENVADDFHDAGRDAGHDARAVDADAHAPVSDASDAPDAPDAASGDS